ncbi:Pycsar system effector family protein [Corallococcus sp. AB049A]|uniref:Pycsar system effector family protein n=1 Tax=Corallococcus sp. AB049A TaxID=2316721 RepID=UPI0011C3C8BB|nr:Pycsar system effector family protein [Corallococcus sp. AB049A]
MPTTKDDVWNIIKRYDGYYAGANTKASILIALNAIAVSGLLVKWQDLLSRFSNTWASIAAGVFLAITAIGSVIALFFAIQSSIPYLGSPKDPTTYHSLVFFEHVADFGSPDKYLSAFSANTDEAFLKDLCYQAFALAQGLRTKHRQVAYAFRAFLFGALIPFGLFLLLLIIQLAS